MYYYTLLHVITIKEAQYATQYVYDNSMIDLVQ